MPTPTNLPKINKIIPLSLEDEVAEMFLPAGRSSAAILETIAIQLEHIALIRGEEKYSKVAAAVRMAQHVAKRNKA